ncbi:MAG: long-chain acyl-CoA synthetase, partial [Alteromonadaceae bacterium]
RLINDFLRDFPLTAEDHHLIFLPLSNYQQRMSVYACLYSGCSLTITNFTQAFSQLTKAKPTFIIAPPAVYENIYNTFNALPNSGEKIRQFLGGKMRFMITGMAAIKTPMLLEAYGVTETGMIAWNTPEANRQGSVGKAVHPDEVILNDDGEVIIRRQYPLSLGYFQAAGSDAQQTFLSSGDIATGDIAQIDDDGFITLVGRKKEIITTAAGVKFHPEIVENQLNQITGVLTSVVVWQTQSSQLYGVICVKNKADNALIATIEKAVEVYNLQCAPWMRVVKLVVTDQAFSIEAGTLTRNMKLNRKGVAAKHLDAQAVETHLETEANE